MAYRKLKKAQQDLFSSLLESYRTLLRFSVENKIEYAITSDDAGVLSRKFMQHLIDIQARS